MDPLGKKSFKMVLDLLVATYTMDEIKNLVGSFLKWDGADLKYYDDKPILELLSDIILRDEESIIVVLNKCIDDVPLLLNHSSESSKTFVKWRLSCGK